MNPLLKTAADGADRRVLLGIPGVFLQPAATPHRRKVWAMGRLVGVEPSASGVGQLVFETGSGVTREEASCWFAFRVSMVGLVENATAETKTGTEEELTAVARLCRDVAAVNSSPCQQFASV
jgi:hypothetical protein